MEGVITSFFAHRQVRVGAFGLLLAVLLTFLAAAPGMAHDTLTDSAPADGDSGPAPTEVELTFSGEIAAVGAAVEVSGPDGVVSEGAPEVDGATVIQTLAADVPAGDYQVVWRVTSSDGHPISGEYAFTVEEAAPADGTGGGDAADSTGGSTDEGDATGDATDEESSAEPSDDGAGDGAGDGADDPVTGDQADSEDSDGMPVWTWIVIVVALLGLGVVVLRVVRNSR